METVNWQPLFEHHGYLYILNKESGVKVIWCCDNYRRGQCGARLHTINGWFVQTLYEHHHEPSNSSAEVIVAHTTMSNGSKQKSDTTHDIVDGGISKISDHAISSRPSLRNVKRTVERIRQQNQNPLSLRTA